MKQNIYDEFLTIYKNLESSIQKMKNAPIDANVRWLEETMSDSEKRNKLYICRITRNYIQHNSDFQLFINISDGMIEFLKEIFIEVSSQQINNTDIMISGKQFLIKDIHDNILDTIKEMETKKQYFVPILNESKLVGIFTDKIMRQMLIKNGKCEKTFDKIEKIFKIPSNIKFVKTENSIEKTLEFIKNGYIVFCTDNGKSTGKIEGMIREEEIKKIKTKTVIK